MGGQQYNEQPLARDDERLLRPSQECFQSRFSLDREAHREKVRRQEKGERQSRQPVDQERPPRGMPAVVAAAHATTATMARMPSTASATPITAITPSAARPR